MLWKWLYMAFSPVGGAVGATLAVRDEDFVHLLAFLHWAQYFSYTPDSIPYIWKDQKDSKKKKKIQAALSDSSGPESLGEVESK